ncbi:MAG: N-acetyl-gamma-glutamyl-phosphate reductase [Cytophagales bacterium]|nr:N-acetyl-gamma-glutamyl-phosphate reductase [Cytophagales bacterium]
MIEAGIIGSSGYVAGELLRCLLHHPNVNINFLYSHSQAEEPACETHQDLFAYPNLKFTNRINPNADVVFLCLGHGHSAAFLSKHKFSEHTAVIDLSNDFRLQADSVFEGKKFVYGLPEKNKSAIRSAQYIANPGCFATAIELALLPLAKEQLLDGEVHVHAVTGSTGAGKNPTASTHFSWRASNVSIYKAFSHQHLGEIGENLRGLQQGFDQPVNFLPVRGDFARGIFASAYLNSSLEEENLQKLFGDYYSDALFTHVSRKTVNLKQVVNTNNCLLQVQKLGGKVLVTSAIDNLLKGASGQAIQNMNLMFGLKENAGLQLKASAF